MPKIIHVKKAQQRYRTVPVLGPDDRPVRTPVMDKRTGEQKVTKTGRPVFVTKTVSDKSQPLEDLDCDFTGCQINDGKIAVGSSYKHMTPHGSPQKSRHEEHPDWSPWEYSDALWARVAQVQNDADSTISDYQFGSYDDFEDLRSQVAEMAGELRDEKQENLDAMPDGLAEGSELSEQVDALESWVQEIEDAEAPDEPEPEMVTKFYVTGPDAQSLAEDGYEDEQEAQDALDDFLDKNPEEDEDEWDISSEEEEPEEGDSEEIDEEWAEDARQAIRDALESYEG